MKRIFCLVLVLLGLFALNVSFSAALAENAQFYVVSYDLNGASYSIEGQAKYPGIDLVLSSYKPTYLGHVFLGWAASPDASQPEYQPEDTFSIDADTTLYAVWMDCMDLDTISGNGTFNIAYPIQKRFAYVKFTPSESGNYVIRSTNGFYAHARGSTRLEFEKDYGDYTIWDSVNLDYSWEQDDFSGLVALQAGTPYYLFYYHGEGTLELNISNEIYTVSYDLNGASYTIEGQAKYPGVDLVLSSYEPTYLGHVFLGWAASPDASQPEYQPEDTFSIDADTTLYAVWMDCADLGNISEKGTFNITYPIQKRFAYVKFTPSESGNYVIRSTNGFYAHARGSTRLEFEKDYGNYTIWDSVNLDYSWEQDDFSGLVELQAGTTYYLFYYHGEGTLELNISNEIYTISYDLNGASYTIEGQAKYPGVDLVLSSYEPTYLGHVFLGWAASPDASQPEYQPEDTFSIDSDTTLYAVWMDCMDLGNISEKDTFNITYPIQKRFAYVKFTPSESGNYVIRSTNGFYAHARGSTRLEFEKDYGDYTIWDSVNLDYSWEQDDFSGLVELRAGTPYYLFYYHGEGTLELEILFQYSGLSSVERIEQEAFMGTAFSKVEIPAAVKAIGPRAFANCLQLREVHFSGSSVEIAADAFAGCENLLIIAPEGSTAQIYANQNDWTFQPMN